MEDYKTELSSQIAENIPLTNDKNLLGKINFFGSKGEVAETIDFTDKNLFLATIKKEIEYNPDGFKAYPLSTEPELLKAVDDIYYGNCGVENPHSLDWYSQKKDKFIIYEDKDLGAIIDVELTKKQQSELNSIVEKLTDLKNNGVNHIYLTSFDFRENLYTDAGYEIPYKLLETPKISDGKMLKDIKSSVENSTTNSLDIIQKGTIYTTEPIDSLKKRVQDKSIFEDRAIARLPVITTDEISTLNNGLDKLLQQVKATEDIKSISTEIPVVEKPSANIPQSIYKQPTIAVDPYVKKLNETQNGYLGTFIENGKTDFKNFQIQLNAKFILTGDFKLISENGEKFPQFTSLTYTDRMTGKNINCMPVINKLNEKNVDFLKLSPFQREDLFSKNSLNITDVKGRELFTKSLTDKPFNISITRVGGKMFAFSSKILNAFSKLHEAVMG